MSEVVNLLQQTKTVKKEKNKLLSFSILMLLITVFISVSMLLYVFYLKNAEGSIIAEQNQAINVSPEIQEKKVLYLSIKERLTSIAQILAEKDVLLNRFVAIESVIPGNVLVTSVDADMEKIKIVFASGSLAALNTLLEKELLDLPTKKGLEGLKRIQVDSLGIQQAGERYIVSVTFEY